MSSDDRSALDAIWQRQAEKEHTCNPPRDGYRGEPRYSTMPGSYHDWSVYDGQYESKGQWDDDFCIGNFDTLDEAVARYPDSYITN